MGETRVDLLHLLEDLRDAYPGPTQETILMEIVANSLDSGARTITLATDQPAQTLTIVDDGRGMRRRELARYHDIAASTKIRGDTIGFAGVGIKIALLVSAQVVTETRAGRHHVATTWGLASRHRAPWKWTPPRGIVAERGTAIRLTLDNGLSPLLDPGYVETVLRSHFEPLLIWINDAHPAYRRAAASRSEGYHLALATALALAPLAVEPANEHGFVTAFLAAWGGRVDPGPRRRQRS